MIDDIQIKIRRLSSLVKAGLGEWFDADDEKLGKAIYKYSSTEGEIVLKLYDKGMSYQGESNFSLLYNDIESFDFLSMSETLKYNKASMVDEIINFSVNSVERSYKIAISFRIYLNLFRFFNSLKIKSKILEKNSKDCPPKSG